MKTFPIKIQRTRKSGAAGRNLAQNAGARETIIADASMENAAYYISIGLADLYIGTQPRNVEFLNPTHRKSANQRAVKRKMERDFIIRCGLAAQQ